MITFKHILEAKEDNVPKSPAKANKYGAQSFKNKDQSKILEIIKTNCTEFYNAFRKNPNIQLIHRGIKTNKEYMLVDPSFFKRKGTSKDNLDRKGIGLHNVLICKLPQWKNIQIENTA